MTDFFLGKNLIQSIARFSGLALALAGVVGFILAPIFGNDLSENVWGVEPLTYVGAMLLIVGLAILSLSYAVVPLMKGKADDATDQTNSPQHWSQITQQYFELFDHDLGRPLRRILGKERELRAILRVADDESNSEVIDLLDEIERQAPNFRLMMSNIRILVQLESPNEDIQLQPVEPSQVVRRIVDRYTQIAKESQKEVIWWAEPSEFGIVYSDSSAIEHIITNLVDNAMRFASTQVVVTLSKNPTNFFIRVWDDGPGIGSQYQRHIFDRGWTPQVARREEKTSSGLGLFIAGTLARRHGGNLTVQSIAEPDAEHHTEFLLSLPIRDFQE